MSTFSKIFPEDARGYYQQGKLLYNSGSYSKSKIFFTKSLTTGTIDKCHYYLAEIIHQEGDLATAQKHIEIYLKSNPKSKRALALKTTIVNQGV